MNERSYFSIKLFHISDLHFGAEDFEKVNALKNDLQENRPHIICITGDIVDRLWKRNFLKARTFLNEISQFCNRIYVVPGNHDAFFGGLAVNRFKKYLGRDPEFGDHLQLNDVDICIFGVNSTFPSLQHLSNTGNFGKKRIEHFRRCTERLNREMGENRYRNAFKIVLLHHHPLPTPSSHLENMLYLKKAGQFLEEMTREEINLILHGHQRDPCDFSVNYNVGGSADNSMIVLSAGTALKQIDDEQGVSNKTHYHFLTLVERGTHIESVYVQGTNYNVKEKKFIPSKGYYRQIDSDPTASNTLRLKYIIKENGDSTEEGRVSLRAKSRREIKTYQIVFGVDEKTPPVERLSQCNLKVFRNGNPISEGACITKKDDPREKVIEVTLDPPIKEAVEEIAWSNDWPQGWKNLIANGKEEGLFVVSRKTDNLSIEIENKVNRQPIKDFEVIYEDRHNSPTYSKGENHSFEISNPQLFKYIHFRIRI